MTTAEILSHSNTTQQTNGLLEAIYNGNADIGMPATVVAYSWDPSRGYVTLAIGGPCGRYNVTVLADGTITDEAP